jgi:hypothetical protein
MSFCQLTFYQVLFCLGFALKNIRWVVLIQIYLKADDETICSNGNGRLTK